MKSKLLLFFISNIIIVCYFTSCKQKITFPPKAEIKSIAEEAYIFGLPYVLEYRTMYLQAIDRSSGSYVGFGNFLHYGATTADNKDVMTPNRDTPYSWAWLDLRAEPWVLTVPKMNAAENRYYTMQWNDLAGFVVDNVSAMTDGYDGGNYLIAPPLWNGIIPEGILRVIQGETYFMGCLTRTELFDNDDIENVKQIQAGYRLQPLSQYLGEPAPVTASEIDFYHFMDGKTDVDISFFDCLSFVLQFNCANPVDTILDKMAKIGITPGTNWMKLAKVNKDLAEGAADGMKAMIDTLNHIARHIKGGSATAFGNRSVMGTRYWDRALGAYLGLFGNTPEQAIYKNIGVDVQNEPLNAAKHNYSITFDKDEIPQVQFFWSITMYSMKDRYLVANPLNRYSIGSHKRDLKYNSDKSLTIYLQKDNPGKEKEANWLPAPDGEFYIILRQYGPSKKAIMGEQTIPNAIKTR